jgi:hypothetical protein
LIYLDVVLSFDVGCFELVHCLVGLEGFEIGDDEAYENPVEATSGGEVGDYRHCGIKVAFKLVHGFLV